MKKEIGKNVSSGAKKVERVEKETAYEAEKTETKKPVKKTASKKKSVKKSTPKKEPALKLSKKEAKRKKAEAKEKAAAEKRLAAAKKKAAKKEEKLLKRAKLKEKKLEKKAALKAKKLEKKAALKEKKAERIQAKQEKKAALKEKKLEQRAEKAARREMLKNESKAEKQKRIAREKKERIALRRKKHEARDKARERKAAAREAARERKAENRKHKREQNTERRKHAPGFGGWLAAVISLGTAALALATVVTAGAVRMNEMDMEATSGYRSTLYEMVSVSEDMDNNFSKLRVSTGSEEQRKLLTDLLVDSELMESALERIPVDSATSTDISSFVNRTGSYARRLLNKLASGKTLTDTELNTVNYLYEVNSALYNELNDIVMNMDDGDLHAFMNGGKSDMQNKFSEAGQGTHKDPENIVDAPFSGEGNVGENQLTKQEEITSERAEQLVKDYFNGYHVTETRMTGEGTAHGAGLYNFVLTDENGNEIYAEITKNGGKLIFFDTYEECHQKNFDLETCDQLAREYLASLGIKDVEASFLSDTGMVANITYVSKQGGVRVYPESIKVRVCEEKGRVVGIDASGYLFNHTERSFSEPEVGENAALDVISKDLTPYEVNLTLIAINDEEVLAYEIACYTETDTFLVYVDAMSGDEIQMFRIREGEGGKYIR
ncbi:MAG: germination protein YpeB [Clostridia bacterium]|nr:germination protein YpeB [Clostridia bacterium]